MTKRTKLLALAVTAAILSGGGTGSVGYAETAPVVNPSDGARYDFIKYIGTDHVNGIEINDGKEHSITFTENTSGNADIYINSSNTDGSNGIYYNYPNGSLTINKTSGEPFKINVVATGNVKGIYDPAELTINHNTVINTISNDDSSYAIRMSTDNKITLNGSADIYAKGKDYTEGVYIGGDDTTATFAGETTITAESTDSTAYALEVKGEGTIVTFDKSATLTAKGDSAYGIYSGYDNPNIKFEGDATITAEVTTGTERPKAIYLPYKAKIEFKPEKINKITGDVYVNSDSDLKLYFKNADSFLKGNTEIDSRGGEIKLEIANGGTWYPVFDTTDNAEETFTN
ncbi:hypothetical protein [Phascolarctobacterium sp.]|uniref:hypothetical protein n=1 Tax=Phascolarctobacterium sp. TaxID=2049039 RepID=UPI00386E3670